MYFVDKEALLCWVEDNKEKTNKAFKLNDWWLILEPYPANHVFDCIKKIKEKNFGPFDVVDLVRDAIRQEQKDKEAMKFKPRNESEQYFFKQIEKFKWVKNEQA